MPLSRLRISQPSPTPSPTPPDRQNHVCPITLQAVAHLRQPYRASDGFTYERADLCEWLRRNGDHPTSPTTTLSMAADQRLLGLHPRWSQLSVAAATVFFAVVSVGALAGGARICCPPRLPQACTLPIFEEQGLCVSWQVAMAAAGLGACCAITAAANASEAGAAFRVAMDELTDQVFLPYEDAPAQRAAQPRLEAW